MSINEETARASFALSLSGDVEKVLEKIDFQAPTVENLNDLRVAEIQAKALVSEVQSLVIALCCNLDEEI